MTITLGWWLLPTLVTIASFGFALWPDTNPSAGYGTAIVGCVFTLIAACISLAAWLIWALAV